MSPKKGQTELINCPRCKILMEEVLQRSFGDMGIIYECPKCKGIIQR